MTSTSRTTTIGITLGDPAGVGPEITCKALATMSPAERASTLVVGNIPLLERAAQTGENWAELAAREIELFRHDMTALRVLPTNCCRSEQRRPLPPFTSHWRWWCRPRCRA